MNNINVGFCRKGDKEFHQFLTIAKASCGELKSMLYLLEDNAYVSSEVAIKRRTDTTKNHECD